MNRATIAQVIYMEMFAWLTCTRGIFWFETAQQKNARHFISQYAFSYYYLSGLIQGTTLSITLVLSGVPLMCPCRDTSPGHAETTITRRPTPIPDQADIRPP